ncbi:hypothetical protein R70006_04969 [Paraburkholderia domus]|uniref:ATPase, T2SS/T4P/T4SS family n=1 Tax=Paraburkholderia domus TaxID=2793075 RepID=UPI0019137329|nr:ATPase, T2SS/T4P/T4SS family [Paraburkholderia domus]MBK5051795.1 Flp pilus assembly complex ATPase component TadA [Burkholderia sp. R-70006]CAE6793708.1 hypothetical protein R70006_04969 [Paraburkholderia domus]
MKITETEFADLYIGNDWASVAGFKGNEEQISLPTEYEQEVQEIRDQCFEIEHEAGVDEFSIRRSGILFRVTCYPNTDGKTVFIIRRPLATIMPFHKVGFGTSDMEFLLRPDLRGLVIFSGDMRSGKTTAAASLTAARLISHGGTAIVIEDPPETPLDGPHGRGRAIQVEARGEGAYKAQVKKAMRSGAKLIYLGEVRDSETAGQVITASNNGNFILTTTHALSPKDAVMRLCNLGTSVLEDPAKVLSSGLAAVIHMSLDAKIVNSSSGPKQVKKISYKMLRVEKDSIVMNLIREKAFHMLDNVIDDQLAKQSLRNPAARQGSR